MWLTDGWKFNFNDPLQVKRATEVATSLSLSFSRLFTLSSGDLWDYRVRVSNNALLLLQRVEIRHFHFFFYLRLKRGGWKLRLHTRAVTIKGIFDNFAIFVYCVIFAIQFINPSHKILKLWMRLIRYIMKSWG